VQKLVMCYGPYAGFGMRQWPQRRSKTEKYAINFPLWAAVWELLRHYGPAHRSIDHSAGSTQISLNFLLYTLKGILHVWTALPMVFTSMPEKHPNYCKRKN
jgi:hypothetical protein